MKPLTIEDLQESSEDYKRLFKERKLKYIAETEATEEEFLMREFELWHDCIHLLNFEKNYQDTYWHSHDRQHVKVLVEGIAIMGLDKVYYPCKRKLEYLETLKTSVNHTSITLPVEPTTLNHIQEKNQEVKPDGIVEKVTAKSKKSKSSEYYLRSICIAIFCLGVTVDSEKGKKLLQKHIGNPSPPGLKNNIISSSSEITSIAENPNEDKWRKIFINEAKRLLNAEKNQKAIQLISEYQKAFETNLESYKRRITG